MAKARVTLTRALTFTNVRGRSFVKGKPQIIDSDSDIQYFRSHPEFSVTILKEVDAPKKAPPAPEPEGGGREPVTAESLGKMTKTDLINFAASEPYNLALSNEMTKVKMVEAIMDIIETAGTLGDDDGDDD